MARLCDECATKIGLFKRSFREGENKYCSESCLADAQKRDRLDEVRSLFDKEKLSERAENAEDEDVRSAARERLQQLEREDELFEAVRLGQLEQVKDLIESGVSANATRDNGWTPLFTAVGEGHSPRYQPILVYLLENGANVNARIKTGSFAGFTPLDYANAGVHIPASVKQLLRKHGGR